ncbi:MAG: extracellular solute-binding protein [Bacillota bacterium]
MTDPTGGRVSRRGCKNRYLVYSLLVVLAFAVVMPLAGCLRLARPGVTIILWDGPRWADESGNRYHWVQRKIAEFESRHPFVEVVFVPVEWWNLREMLDAAKEAGRLPDLAPFDLSAGGISLAEVEEGLLEPVEGVIARPGDLSEQALAAYAHGDHLWGFPLSMTGHALLLNLDLFAERGVEPPPDGRWTWAEFTETCRRLTFDRDGDKATDVWGFAAHVLPGYYEIWPFLYAAGARPLSSDLETFTFDTEASLSALRKLVDLVFAHKAAHPMTGSAAVRGVFQLFADVERQEVAIEPWSAWAIDYLYSEEGTIKNFAVADYPYDGPGSPVGVGGTAGFVVFRQDDAHKRNLVVSLANYLTDTVAQYELARGYRVFPARRSALDLDPFGGDPVYRRAAEIAFRSESLPRHPRWPEIERVIQKELQLALLGIKTPEKALEDARAAVEPVLPLLDSPPGD